MKFFFTLGLVIGIGHAVSAQSAYEILDVVVMRDQPIVRGEMNGKTAYFLLDTGSDVSLINTGDAEKYGFSYITNNGLKGYQLAGLGASTNELFNIYNIDLRLGSQKIKAIFIAYDLSNIIRSLNTNTPIRINGIIGSKALRKHGFVIDYDLKEVKMKLR
ncbi:MAG: retropepsin-like aspartic protease [Cyclobacteriaceae bacterium]